LAVMRSQWSPRASTVAIDYSSLGMRVAVHAGGTPLFAGVWGASSRLNGRVLKPTGPWEEVCWFTDQDVDFMELVLPLEGEARLERQILLARSDEFLLLADHLQTAESEQLEHSWTLPLAGGVSWTGEVETREARIARVDGEPLARALPLALPEWRIDPRVGELTYADGLMRLEERTVGRALACPLFFDLKPKRIGRPCTWRQLTVAELLKIQPPDVAVAYRAQCGKNQWVIYRSQAPRGNRTFLGQNTSSEFYVARFLARDGSVEELVQVEG
ncbi:MAG TPA: hypothetical protein VEQ85_13635, partial [Lacipirellulaceae bacterium]|nr:hypothetical protein [Lacipirellulaceae bacterium]